MPLLSPARWTRDEIIWIAAGLYYDRLNADPAFRQALTGLFDQLDALPDKASRNEAVRGFCDTWPLPARAPEDLLWSHNLRPWQGDRLVVGDLSGFVPTPGLPVVTDIIPGDGDTPAVRVVEHQPWILPNVPLPFLYDPLAHDRRWLREQVDAICRDIRESILAQAENLEQQVEQAGWGPLPPAWHNPDKLRQAVDRLYLRAIKRKSWGEIAMRARTRRSSVQEQVTQLATLLGVPIPTIS